MMKNPEKENDQHHYLPKKEEILVRVSMDHLVTINTNIINSKHNIIKIITLLNGEGLLRHTIPTMIIIVI